MLLIASHAPFCSWGETPLGWAINVGTKKHDDVIDFLRSIGAPRF
jgi:hypothetical protein